MMGEDSGRHSVTISRHFLMGKYPVTQAQWEAIMGNNPSHFIGADRPVENVSWDDCWAFIKKLNVMTGSAYRLPTEAEWEYACRAGSTTAYCFGDDEAQLSDYAWYDANSKSETHPVGRKKANAWGLHDMHGNVWEWCHDWYGDYPAGSAIDPTGQSSGSFRVLRGGCCSYVAGYARAASRNRFKPSYRSISLGFRVVLPPDR